MKTITITPQQHEEMMEFLDDLAQAVRVRKAGGDVPTNIQVFPDEFEAVVNLRDSYLAMKAREDQRLANLKRSQQSKSPHKVATARANLQKGRNKVEQMRASDPEFRQKAIDNLAKAREKRGSSGAKLIKKAKAIVETTET